jgi:hypothetical protein
MPPSQGNRWFTVQLDRVLRELGRETSSPGTIGPDYEAHASDFREHSDQHHIERGAANRTPVTGGIASRAVARLRAQRRPQAPEAKAVNGPGRQRHRLW